MPAVFEHLSTSLHRELDFRQEARNMERMREVIEPFSRLAVPVLFADFSTSRLLVMRDVQRRTRSRSRRRGRSATRSRSSSSSPSTSR